MRNFILNRSIDLIYFKMQTVVTFVKIKTKFVKI